MTSHSSPRQLVLDLPVREACDAEDFLVSHSNSSAVRLIDLWPDWSNSIILMVGPAGSGKSHLANVWRKKSDAKVLFAGDIEEQHVIATSEGDALIVEDLDKAPINEKAIFHLLNLAKEKSFEILMTARTMPGDGSVKLPDLRSRLCSLEVVTISEPDETLLKTVLVKHFADRQLSVAPHMIDYIALRMERSMDFAHRLVEEIDRMALSSGRKITRQLAGDVLRSILPKELL